MCADDAVARLDRVRERIERACALSGRAADAVTLVAVGKQQPASKVVALARLGQRDFAENYAQEGIDKIQQTTRQLTDTATADDTGDDTPPPPPSSLCWHFIGHIQSRKCRLIAENFDWAHSVDSLKVARGLSKWRSAQPDAPPLNVLLQLNLQAEESKHGISEAQLPALADEVAALPGIALRGLMLIPKPDTSERRQRAVFRRCRAARDELNARGMALDHLSMGMSADMESAIAEGASLVRIGTAVFGPRPPKSPPPPRQPQ